MGTFNADSHDEMALMVEEILDTFKQKYEKAGCDAMAKYYVDEAFLHLQRAVLAFKQASVSQARALGDLRLRR